MAIDSPHQTFFTRQVQRLLDRVYGQSSVKDSLLDRAIVYFEQEESKGSVEYLTENEQSLQQLKCNERHANLSAICFEIIELSEGESFTETNRKSAQFLGTIQLLSDTEGKKIAVYNEKNKAVYKAILALRLLDRLIIDGQIVDLNILKYLNDISGDEYFSFSSQDADAAERFVKQIKIPLIMAALLQDIGNYHPQAQTILYGSDGKLDPFRTLELVQRKELLQINYQQTIKYLTEGVGIPAFIGNTKAEREDFYADEHEKQKFIIQLLKLSVNPKKSIGNVLKVPQIYTSIILSTKASYNYKLLPQVYQVLNKNAELGACAQGVVDALYKITGMFPQGFGVVYIPLGEFGEQSDCYEYAIVNGLYPEKPKQPLCRMVTRNLAFMGFGHDVVIKENSNLYFTQTAKKLSKLSKERLNEILELLSSNAEERKKLDLLPRCWHTKEYFSVKTNQKLWNKVE
jgi:hypothetical protein